MGRTASIFAGFIFLFSSSVGATDSGVITVNGSLRSGTCNPSVNGGGADGTVDLVSANISSLSFAGATADNTSFYLEVKGCQLSTGGKVYVYFDSAQTSVNAAGRLNNMASSDSATMVEFQILNKDKSVINLAAGAGSQGAGDSQSPNASGYARFDYSIEYYATGASSAGVVTSMLAYTLNYL